MWQNKDYKSPEKKKHANVFMNYWYWSSCTWVQKRPKLGIHFWDKGIKFISLAPNRCVEFDFVMYIPFHLFFTVTLQNSGKLIWKVINFYNIHFFVLHQSTLLTASPRWWIYRCLNRFSYFWGEEGGRGKALIFGFHSCHGTQMFYYFLIVVHSVHLDSVKNN